MIRIAVFLLIGLIAGFAIATLSGRNEPDGPDVPDAFFSDSGLAERVARLEASLEDERFARLELEAQLAEFRQMAEQGQPFDSGPENRAGAGTETTEEIADSGQQEAGPPARLQRFRRNDPVAMAERFVEAGLSAERANYIVQRTEELRLEALQARYDAARDGSATPGAAVRDVNATLRAELGDADYERYLTALGRPVDVRVASVLASSPAAQAGFLDGDRIVGYAGQRVYDMAEITELTLEGEPGESVVIDIIRDGQPMQLYLPRGPLGITGGGRFRRGP